MVFDGMTVNHHLPLVRKSILKGNVYMNFNVWQVLGDMTRGFGVTLALFGLTLLFALPLGLIFALLSMAKFKPVSYTMKVIIWVVRGTPLLLQCIVVSFIPYVFGIANLTVANFLNISSTALQFVFVLIAFSLNYACYFAVIYEGGIRNVPRGQYEAGQVLGMTKGQIFFKVVLMQVIRKITAPMSNEIITLVKDTALAKALSVAEILFYANNAVNNYVNLTPLLYAALFYLAFSGLLTILFHFIEKKLSYYQVT